MSDELENLENETDDTDEGLTPEEAHKKANRQLQAHLKKVEAENRELRLQVIGSHLRDIGLNHEQGLGKAIAKEYSGEMSADAIAAFAQSEYGYASEPEQIPAAVAVAQKLDQLQGQSQPLEPVTTDVTAQLDQKLGDPEATRQDAAASLTAKVSQFVDQVYGAGGPVGPPR